MIKSDGSSGRLDCSLFTGDESVFDQMRFEARRFGALERREIGFEKLFWSGVKEFD
jgi:hypothetical protein